MSWLLDLYETYENNEDYVGITDIKEMDRHLCCFPFLIPSIRT